MKKISMTFLLIWLLVSLVAAVAACDETTPPNIESGEAITQEVRETSAAYDADPQIPSDSDGESAPETEAASRGSETVAFSDETETKTTSPIPIIHEHSYESQVVDPTCNQGGYTLHVCYCGDRYTDEETKPSGHRFKEGICVLCQRAQDMFEVTKVEILCNGQAVGRYQTTVDGGDLHFSLCINDGADLQSYLPPMITWRFVGEDYGSYVTSEGVVTVGRVLGEVTLQVTVESLNRVIVTLPITVTLGEDLTLDALTVTTNAGYDQAYVEGEAFDARGITVWGECGTGLVQIPHYTFDDAPLTPEMTELVISYDDKVTEIPITVAHKQLQALKIVTPPDRCQYLDGQFFDRTGMTVRADFEHSSEIITDFFVDESSPLTTETAHVRVSYTYHGVTKTTDQPVQVTPKKLIALSVDASGARTEYTRGDVFKTSGLVVTAYFEDFGEVEVTDYQVDLIPLTPDDQTVTVSYSSNGRTATAQVDIQVYEPYEKTSRLAVLTPTDVSISWFYSYMTPEGEKQIDNTDYTESGLSCDKHNGFYDIPLGAVVTATVKNPAVVNLELNGVIQEVDYEEKTATWVMGNAEVVVIRSVELTGEHTVVRFASSENEQSFLYDGSWKGSLTQENLQRLHAVFADTDTFAYTYWLDGEAYTLDDLSRLTLPHHTDTTVVVIKNEKGSDARHVTLKLWQDAQYTVRLSKNAVLTDLPAVTRSGYRYCGWSLTENGAVMTAEDMKTYLSAEQSSYVFYALFQKETVNYGDMTIDPDDLPVYGSSASGEGGEPEIDNLPFHPSEDGDDIIDGTNMGHVTEEVILFVGDWQMTVSDGAQTLSCKVNFAADGSFTYEVIYNQEVNCRYLGLYRLPDALSPIITYVSVISVDTDMDIPLVSGEDFGFCLMDGELSCRLVAVLEDSLVFTNVTLEKDTSKDTVPPIKDNDYTVSF